MTSVQDEVTEEIKKITGGYRYVTLEIAQILRDRVLNACKAGGVGDPLDKDKQVRDRGRAWYLGVWSFLSDKGWLLPARNLLRDLWESHADLQRRLNRRVWRALLSQLLTQTSHQLGNSAEALRWSLLTQADNMLGEDPQEGGYSKHWLYGIFGLSDVERKALNTVAKECLDEANPNRWDSPCGFAEEVLRRFAQNDQNGRAVFQRFSSTEEFYLTRSYLRVLLDHMDRTPKGRSKVKGERLETIASYLFSLLSGCVLQKNVHDLAGASEHDLVVSNMSSASSLIGDVFGRDFLIECKNWNRTVGVKDVGYFLFRMGLTHRRFGVIIAARNITGRSTSDTHARAVVRRAFHEHGSACVVVSMTDLEELARGQISGVTSLLIERLSELRFGK